MNVQQKFLNTRSELLSCLLEREEEVNLALTALLAGENCLFVGPPGTAKSMLADAIVDWIDGTRFSILMNKFTKPEEVFGPIDIMGLKNGVHQRIVDHTLVDAEVAFLDEIFKASSAVLNTTLKILNEGTYRNGSNVINCPLKLCIAASNEWPTEAKELGALFDRFLFRKSVTPVMGEDNIERLMFDTTLSPSLSTKLTIPELKAAQVECLQMTWEPEAKEALHGIRRKITSEGILVGDRRRRKTTMAVQCYAWLNGNNTVSTDDLEVLSHIWWSDPNGQPGVIADAIGEIAKPSGLLAAQLLAEANSVVAGSNPKDFAETAKSAAKLNDIIKQLKKQSGPRAEQALQRVTQMATELKRQSLASIS